MLPKRFRSRAQNWSFLRDYDPMVRPLVPPHRLWSRRELGSLTEVGSGRRGPGAGMHRDRTSTGLCLETQSLGAEKCPQGAFRNSSFPAFLDFIKMSRLEMGAPAAEPLPLLGMSWGEMLGKLIPASKSTTSSLSYLSIFPKCRPDCVSARLQTLQ